MKDEKGQDIIYIDLSNIQNEKPSSIQYWYLDSVGVDYTKNEFGIFKESAPDYSKASYKFVFGVNVTEEDYKNGFIKIYVSNISSLNMKVYDENYNLIGEVENIANKKITSQTYTKYKEAE
jgi:hypothetical protein